MRTLIALFVLMNTISLSITTSAVAAPAGQIAVQVNRISVQAFQSLLPTPELKRPKASDLQVMCMTAALYHEARGERRTGQLAVARVILNRARSRVYPDSVCGVVYQNAVKRNRCQFSFACDGLSDYPRNAKSHRRLKALSRAILEDNITDRLLPTNPREFRDSNFDQITHYHTTAVSPSWSRKIGRIGAVGAHIFYRSQRVARSL